MPATSQAAGPAHTPYATEWANQLYNLLFCDRPQDFHTQPGTTPAAWQTALCTTTPDLQAAAALLADRDQEARVRMLASHVLRANGVTIEQRELLGVVVEVPLDGGLDTLAAYVDGSVRYIHHSGHVDLLDPLSVTLPIIQRLVGASAQVVARIGPWHEPRLPAPPLGQIRLSFLVTDGLYFGQGDMAVMQRDGMAGPLIDHATELLQAVIGLSNKRAA